MQTSPTIQPTPQGGHPATDGELSLGEALSALFDGECSGPQAAALTRAYPGSEELQQRWARYQCLGDALRARESEQVSLPASPSFVSAVMARVAGEPLPVVSAPEVLASRDVSVSAANESVFRWKMVAGVATLAAVVAVAWQVAVAPAPTSAPQLAQSAPPVVVASQPAVQRVVTEQGVVLRDPQLEELMAAHRQYGSMSALQMPAGFLRNATYEAPQR